VKIRADKGGTWAKT